MVIAVKPIEEKQDPLVKEMMEVGLHFGHKTSKTHPKMKPYITGVRNTVHIIDLEKTKQKLEEMASFIQELKKDGKTLLLVGTKVHQRPLIEAAAKACGLPYVTGRWIGGTLTNFKTIVKRIERLKDLKAQLVSGEWAEKYTKKEQQDLKEEIAVLEGTFGGIQELTKTPDAVFVCDLDENRLAVKEAKNIGIPVIAIADTNSNPDEANTFVPANNDATSSVSYIVNKIQEAWMK